MSRSRWMTPKIIIMLKQIFIPLFSLILFSLNAQSIWTKSDVSTFRDAAEEDKMIMPTAYEAYTLSFEDIVTDLSSAPEEEARRKGLKGKLISMPTSSGKMETFEVFYSPMMAPGLAARYPGIRSYKGYSTTKKGKNVRFDLGPYGFHAAIHSVEGVSYIDPYARGNTSEYIL